MTYLFENSALHTVQVYRYYYITVINTRIVNLVPVQTPVYREPVYSPNTIISDMFLTVSIYIFSAEQQIFLPMLILWRFWELIRTQVKNELTTMTM